jgi:hypothetical protein
MAKVFDAMSDEAIARYEENEDALRTQYEEEVDQDADSFESKEHRLSDDDCFFEWVLDTYESPVKRGQIGASRRR